MAFDVLSFVMGQQTAKSGGGSDIELIENMPFVVDFSEGDQFIEAPEGYAVKSAVVKKPENLVAENIAKDVNIAGIIGTLASGGSGGGGVVINRQLVKPTAGQTFTLEHGLGVTPDIVFAYVVEEGFDTQGYYTMAWGCSTACYNLFPLLQYDRAIYTNSSGRLAMNDGSSKGIETSDTYFIKNANDTTVTFGSRWTNVNWNTSYYHYFYFIGGLT